MYLLLRRWEVRPTAALVAAAGYALSGHLLSLGCFFNALAAAAPARSACSRPTWSPAVAPVSVRCCSVRCGRLQAMGGEPVVGVASALLAAGYLLLVAEGSSWRSA